MTPMFTSAELRVLTAIDDDALVASLRDLVRTPSVTGEDVEHELHMPRLETSAKSGSRSTSGSSTSMRYVLIRVSRGPRHHAPRATASWASLPVRARLHWRWNARSQTPARTTLGCVTTRSR